MQYTGIEPFDHSRPASVGILIANIGTPDAPTPRALRPYLKTFLSDPRVIEKNPLIWGFILNCFILPFRPRTSAKLYKKIWTDRGSPLLFNTYDQRNALLDEIRSRTNTPVAVEVGMRIGTPSIEDALRSLQNQGVRQLIVLPMFPQYSGTTTGSVFDGVSEVLRRFRLVPDFRMVTTYHDHPKYIAALANTVRELWEKEGEPEKLLFSFHGIPKRYFLSGDPYYCYCQKTARLVAEALHLPQEKYIVCFQSLFGKEEWLKPYTIDTMTAFPSQGIKKLDVICPAFAADCLETLEEIDETNREAFMHAGGEHMRYIPALNARADFISALADIVFEHGAPWFKTGAEERSEQALCANTRYQSQKS